MNAFTWLLVGAADGITLALMTFWPLIRRGIDQMRAERHRAKGLRWDWNDWAHMTTPVDWDAELQALTEEQP